MMGKGKENDMEDMKKMQGSQILLLISSKNTVHFYNLKF